MLLSTVAALCAASAVSSASAATLENSSGRPYTGSIATANSETVTFGPEPQSGSIFTCGTQETWKATYTLWGTTGGHLHLKVVQ